MEAWVGPAIVAAVVSGVISVAGWFVNSWQARRLEQSRRDEKVHDFQVALGAEIESDLDNMQVSDRPALLEEVRARYGADAKYVAFVPRLASNVVFEAIVPDIHILPGDVIAPVIDYARLRQTLERFAEDLRSSDFKALSPERQLAMYEDYLSSLGRLETLAKRANEALANSLNNSDEGQLSPPSEGASAEAALVREQGEP